MPFGPFPYFCQELKNDVSFNLFSERLIRYTFDWNFWSIEWIKGTYATGKKYHHANA
jgi:hypothetical protein